MFILVLTRQYRQFHVKSNDTLGIVVLPIFFSKSGTVGTTSWDRRKCYQSDNVISLGSFSKSCMLKLASFNGKWEFEYCYYQKKLWPKTISLSGTFCIFMLIFVPSLTDTVDAAYWDNFGPNQN
jgi:hypothetical protein